MILTENSNSAVTPSTATSDQNDIRQITNNETIKSIEEIPVGTKVYINWKKWIINSVLKYSVSVKTDTEQETTKDFFLPTEHVKLVSEMVNNAKEEFDFSLKINTEVYHMFEEHWIKMCKNEKNPKAYAESKTKFDKFIEELKQAMETLRSLSVGGKAFLKI